MRSVARFGGHLCVAWVLGSLAFPCREIAAQVPWVRHGPGVSAEVRLIYERGLRYLAGTQKDDGSWGGHGITGLCLMAFLASGEDPNFGRYNVHVRKAVRSIIQAQNSSTGFIPTSMYNHGFAMLALAEAYGAVDEGLLWDVESGRQRSIGAALELAVRCALTSQEKNSCHAWRYSPDSTDADTSVSGAVLVGLLAARNAGIEVPEEATDKAFEFYRSMTSGGGEVGYSSASQGQSMNRSAVATLVYAIGKKKDWKEYHATLGYLRNNLEHQEQGHKFYFRYYMAQALFQGDAEAWTRWDRENTRMLGELQEPDGSVFSNHGPDYGTAMALLSLALNFRVLPIYER